MRAPSARNSDGVNSILVGLVWRDWREVEAREAEVMVISASVRIVSGEWNCSDGANWRKGWDSNPR